MSSSVVNARPALLKTQTADYLYRKGSEIYERATPYHRNLSLETDNWS